MSEGVQKFDPATLMQGVKDRIKATFVSLIPDEQWEQMVQAEVDKFFRIRKEDGYGRRETTTEFELLVNQCLKEESQKRMAEYLSSPQFQDTWSDKGGPIMAEAVRKLLIENSGEIFTTMMGGMFSSMLQNFRQQLQNRQF